MRKTALVLVVFAALIASSVGAIKYAEKSIHDATLLPINREYDERTIVKGSTVPGAGNGLFAKERIKKGEVIGELGGRLVVDGDPSVGRHHLGNIPECAWGRTHPYRIIDSRDHGGNVSRINFAPSEINGIQTNLQNAAIRQVCEPPYFFFIASMDIEIGAEVFSSYGPNYSYDDFMQIPEVRDFFCGLVKTDCSERYSYLY